MAARQVQLSGSGTIGGSSDDLAWKRTGVDLDSERPRALLIEDVEIVMPEAPLAAAHPSADVVATIAVSTGRVTRTASAPRNRLNLGAKRLIVGKDSTSAAGYNTATVTGDETRLLRGTLWVAPWIGLIQSASSRLAELGSTTARIKYRVVDIDFDLAHALFDQVDEAVDTQNDWWNV